MCRGSKKVENTGLERGWNNGGQTGDGGPDPSGGRRVGRREGCAEHGGGCVEIVRACVRRRREELRGRRRRRRQTAGFSSSPVDGTFAPPGEHRVQKETMAIGVARTAVWSRTNVWPDVREREGESAGASNRGKLLSRKRGQRERAAAAAEFP